MTQEKKPSEELEKRVTVMERVKYMAAPAAVTAGSAFTPEMKEKYASLPKEKQETYKTVAVTTTGIIGTALAAISAYKLFKKYSTKKDESKSD